VPDDVRPSRSKVNTVSARILIATTFVTAAAAVTGVVVLSAFTSWWVLFALFGVPPLLMMVGAAGMMTTDRSLGRLCAAMPCAAWFDSGLAREASLR
jgi:hypothetical protein